jgi:hypothetical protein
MRGRLYLKFYLIFYNCKKSNKIHNHLVVGLHSFSKHSFESKNLAADNLLLFENIESKIQYFQIVSL